MSRNIRLAALLTFGAFLFSEAKTPESFYEIRIFLFSTKLQEAKINSYLKNAYLPALHRAGILKVGVYAPIEKDTASFGKKLFVFIPYANLDQYTGLAAVLAADKKYEQTGADYLTSAFDAPPYKRVESILLQAFVNSPRFAVPVLSGSKADQVYELRSYESATENLAVNKIRMFNSGDEIGLFKRLGFNPVFYARVLSGSHMPNLMYMTSFNTLGSREEHWKTFSDDPQWKTLKADPAYQNNVSHADIFLLHPTEYSEL